MQINVAKEQKLYTYDKPKKMNFFDCNRSAF